MKNNKKTFARRALALLLAVMMCFSMVMSAAATTVDTKVLDCNDQNHNETGEHTAECYEYYVLTCSEPVIDETNPAYHKHSDDCYVSEEALCGITEHAHTVECVDDTAWTCANTEEGHVHTLECPHEENYSCGSQEHTHEAECYKSEILLCGKEENLGHQHDASCYEWVFYTDDTKATIGNVADYTELEYANSIAAEPGDKYKRRWCVIDHHHTSECYKDKPSEQVIGEVNSALEGNNDVTLNLQDGYELKETGNGKINDVGNGKTLNITGQGTIKAIENGFSVIRVVGGHVVINGNVTITGGTADKGAGVYVDGGTLELQKGTISGNHSDTDHKVDNIGTTVESPAGQGGGVYVKNSGTFTMGTENGKNEDAVIEHNTADEGGGVFIENASTFIMNSGSVLSNIANINEGGGIYISGTGTIHQGAIKNNETKSQVDLGGGGIYIENTGNLTMTNALVTNNTAQGLGGGIAACIHGRTVIYAEDGAAIYDNTANGTAFVYGRISDTTAQTSNVDLDHAHTVVDWSHMWRGDQGKDFRDNAQDIFTAGNSEYKVGSDEQSPGIVIGNVMLGGGIAAWKGNQFDSTDRNYTHNADCPFYNKGYGDYEVKQVCNCNIEGQIKAIDATKLSALYSGRLLALTATITDQNAINEAKSQAKIEISGNKSATHGGGIANNGVLTIGLKNSVSDAVDDINVTVNKVWTTDDPTAHYGDRIVTVSLCGPGVSESKELTGPGTAEFTIPSSVLTAAADQSSPATLPYEVTETMANADGVVFDSATTKTFTVTVNKTTETKTVGVNTETLVHYDVSIEGETNITFTNKYNVPRGSLSITKAIGADSVLNADAVADKEFAFKIDGPVDDKVSIEGGTFDLASKTVTITGANTATLSNLPIGVYTVTETDGEMKDYTSTTEVTGNGTVAKDETSSITVTNTYDYARGTLIVSKTAQFDESKQESPDIDFQNKTYTFVITQTEGVAPMNEKDVQGFKEGEVSKDGKAAVLVLTGNESREITKLPVGTYHVIENGAEQEGYTLTVTGDNDKTETLTNGGTISFPVTNTYDYNRGSLTIKKVVDGTADKAVTDAKEYSFTVTTPNTYVDGDYPLTVTPDAVPETTEEPDVTPGPAVSSVKFTKGVSEPIKITGPGLIQIDSLPTGKYTITEADASLPGYSWSVSGSNAVVEVKTGETANSEVTNNYWVPNIPVTRSLNVNKIWEGDEESQTARPGSIQVQLYLNGAAYGSPVALSPANGWSHTWLGLPAEGALTVEELDVPDGYTAAIESSGNTVTITNTYDEEIPDPTPPLGTPRPTATPTPTPAPSDPTPTPDPDEEIPDDNVPLGTPKPEPTPEPEEELPDPDVPKAPAEPDEDIPDEDIPDEDVPLASTPKTGDSRDLWYLLTFLSAAGLVLVAATGRKKSGQSK